ncbi:hypothetical protein PCASD_03597 [Puccinia coronata f. sp. avenae]|uniref:NADH:flavin oxidoreductase/NADH oxidase N-terminal domain-containing protein n=1 Tax=Puccinia coronata f. sp. avenae TaxID=200324 RepID=A0A2N5VDH6_9BASI|nr:hypothetical protein PCASD_03597 [Puccinia coronata f. sp. avenae]
MEPTDQDNINAIHQPIRLPCGLELPNRLVKAAMAPCFSRTGEPTVKHCRLYRQWSQDQFGLLVAENVQVCPRHLASPGDVTIRESDKRDIPPSWHKWAKVCKTSTLIQLSHAGLQSPRGCGRPLQASSIAPSAGRLSLGNRLIDRLAAWGLFNQSKEASKDDIMQIIEQFRSSAKFCHQVGFQGFIAGVLNCQCKLLNRRKFTHSSMYSWIFSASHGFLLSAFLSPKTNKRRDDYGMSAVNRLRIILDIIDAIRSSVPKSFCLAIKLNCSDLSEGGVTMEEALNNIKRIVSHGGIDLIEITGGTYTNFPTSKSDVTSSEAHATSKCDVKSSKTRKEQKLAGGEAYYTDFTKQAVHIMREVAVATGQPRPMLMHTGGFRSRSGMAAAISNQETDLIGLGRPACLDPLLCTKILDPRLTDFSCSDPKVPGVAIWNMMIPVRIVGSGFKTVWYTWQLHLMADYKPPDLVCSALGSLRSVLPLYRILSCLAILLSLLVGVIVARFVS